MDKIFYAYLQKCLEAGQAKHQIELVNDIKNENLPAAFHHEAMHFSATEYDQAAPENAYLRDENLLNLKTPNSPT